jgi:hypothetical protein
MARLLSNPIIAVVVNLICLALGFSGIVSMVLFLICLILAWLFSFFYIISIVSLPLSVRILMWLLWGFVLYVSGHKINKTNRHKQRVLKVRGNKLRAYAGTRAFFHWAADGKEAAAFKNTLSEFLAHEGWTVIQSAGHHADGSLVNVVIEINKTLKNNDRALEAANELIRILRKSNVAVILRESDSNPLPQASMYIRIGPIVE